MTAITIRAARLEDAAAVAAVYAPHVLHGTATFEETPPHAAEMAARMEAVAAERLPWLVAEDGGRVVGYAYASAFRPRPAYRVSVEDSIYLDADACGRGIGRALLQRLIEACAAAGRTTVAAVIGDSANLASIRLHERLGFRHAGRLTDMAFKHGRWLDVVLMQRALGQKVAGVEPSAEPRG